MAAKESRPLPRLQVFILLFHSFHSFPSRRDDTRTVPIVPIGPRWNRIEKDFCVIFTNRFHSELQIFYGGREGERGRMDRKSWIDRNRFLRIFLFFFSWGKREGGEGERRGGERRGFCHGWDGVKWFVCLSMILEGNCEILWEEEGRGEREANNLKKVNAT